MITHARPAILGESLTEGYLTQPSVMVTRDFANGHLRFTGMLNLEGWTLKRGELNHGAWGEGYVDRRHPHTYLHEAVVTGMGMGLGTGMGMGLGTGMGSGLVWSITIGKGFVPFGTDDPMVRPFVKYPANHHLSQILERLVAIGAVRYGPAVVELGTFNGDEPLSPSSNGRLHRFGDSWSARGSLRAVNGVELQASYASLESPEQPRGDGLDQRKRSVSARFEAPVAGLLVYALIENARTADMHGDLEVFVFTSTLAEAVTLVGGWRIAARYEDSTRPEEERTESLFRSVRPATDNSILGTTRFRTWTAAVSRDLRFGKLSIAPFIEASRIHALATDQFPVYKPGDLYGDDHIWNLSAGIRVDAGMKHQRMGRYGAAIN